MTVKMTSQLKAPTLNCDRVAMASHNSRRLSLTPAVVAAYASPMHDALQRCLASGYSASLRAVSREPREYGATGGAPGREGGPSAIAWTDCDDAEVDVSLMANLDEAVFTEPSARGGIADEILPLEL